MARKVKPAPACRSRRRWQSGFTLVEAVVVIVITSIIGTVVAVFLRAPVQGYVDSVARAELSDTADLALRRISRDLRLALPNSVRIDTNYMELLLTSTGGRYLTEDDGVAGQILDFETTCVAPATGAVPAGCKFDVVGPAPNSGNNPIAAGDSIVVHNLGFAPADAYAGGNRAVVKGVSGQTVTLESNVFATQTPHKLRSPTNRFHVVTTPVTYVCNGTESGGNGTLVRYWGYPIQASQPVSAAALAGVPNAILATNVVQCSFNSVALRNTRTGLISIALTLEVANSNSGRITLVHQVHVDNTP